MFFNLIAFNGSCYLNSASEKEQLFGKGSFTRIRVGYNGEGFSPINFFSVLHNGGKGKLDRRMLVELTFGWCGIKKPSFG